LERRTAARDARRARGQSIGRPKVLDDSKWRWRSYTIGAAADAPASRFAAGNGYELGIAVAQQVS
jgi:hypothetical protein